jgi:hypothetical protein
MSGNNNQQIADDLLAMLRSENENRASNYESASYSFSSEAPNQSELSQIELSILRSINPIEITETEEISVLGNRGVWVNKAEVLNWRGDLNINEYIINEDAHPEIITKKIDRSIEYVQELAIRYLRPPTPPTPGEIVITQEANVQIGPAPPLIIRQQPARASTPEPLVVREAPPQPPPAVGPKRITISGKRLPPPPRKVVIERLAPLPSKPQNVIIERWLPYGEVKRRVIFNKSSQADPVVAKPKNVIVQWEAPQVQIRKEIKYLGVIKANPAEYVQRYGATLKQSRDLPQFVLDIQTPSDLVLAADYKYNTVFELEGQLDAFRFVDLDREGLSEYRSQLERMGIRYGGEESVSSSRISTASPSSVAVTQAVASVAASVPVEQIFKLIDKDNNGFISVEEAGRILLRVNSRLGRSYGEDNINELFKILDKNGDGKLNLQEFSAIFNTLKSA